MKCPQCNGKSSGPWLCQLCRDIKVEKRKVGYNPPTDNSKPKRCYPCKFLPGSPEKCKVMEQRFERGEFVQHHLDGIRPNAKVRANTEREENDDNEISARDSIKQLLREFRRHPRYTTRLKSIGRFVRVSGSLVIENTAARIETDPTESGASLSSSC